MTADNLQGFIDRVAAEYGPDVADQVCALLNDAMATAEAVTKHRTQSFLRPLIYDAVVTSVLLTYAVDNDAHLYDNTAALLRHAAELALPDPLDASNAVGYADAVRRQARARKRS
jgi:hypothetical protein